MTPTLRPSTLRLASAILLLVILMLVPTLLFEEQINAYFDGVEGINRMHGYDGLAWLVGICLIISDLFLPMPSTTVIAALGMIYGPVLGGIIGAVGSLLAGLVAYWGCRLIGVSVLNLLVGTTNLQKLERFFARHGLWAIAFSRWMPLLPELLCCLAGMARMRLLPFIASLACGSLAMGFAFASLGSSYLDSPVRGLALSALLPLLLWPFVKRFAAPPPKPI